MDREAAKQKCDRAKAIRTAYHGIISELIREVDKLISTNASTKEVQAHLKVILKHLEAKSVLLNKLDRVILSLCDIDEVEGEIEEAELMVAKLIV